MSTVAATLSVAAVMFVLPTMLTTAFEKLVTTVAESPLPKYAFPFSASGPVRLTVLLAVRLMVPVEATSCAPLSRISELALARSALTSGVPIPLARSVMLGAVSFDPTPRATRM